MTPQEMQAALESIIYAADEPATLDQLARAVDAERAEVRQAVERLMEASRTDERGIEIRKVAGGYKFYTKPQHHEVVRKFIKSLRPPVRLTLPALETLAVIAYKQPVTGPEIQEIRGVNVAGVLQTLLDKKLITTAGRKDCLGRPILYRTSKEFLMRFGLSELDELPSLKEFEQLAQAALGADEGIAAGESTEGMETGGEAAQAEPASGAEVEWPTEAAEDAAASDEHEGDAGAARKIYQFPGGSTEKPEARPFEEHAPRGADDSDEEQTPARTDA
jgi:segregation and condensation protein B